LCREIRLYPVMHAPKILLQEGYGQILPGSRITVAADTVFTTGSITKQFTAAAVIKLREQGLLSLSDTIGEYFKNVPADKQRITLHHLLSHQAGFPGAIGDDLERIGRDDFVRRALAHGKTEEGADWGTIVDRAFSAGGPGWNLVGNGGNRVFFSDFLRYLDRDVDIYYSTSSRDPRMNRLGFKLARIVLGDEMPELERRPAAIIAPGQGPAAPADSAAAK